MMKKIIITTVISLLGIMSSLYAQQFEQHKHEFSIYGGAGASTLTYKTNIGDRYIRMGGLFGLGYGYFFNPQWGLNTGVEFASYNSRYQMKALEDNYSAIDIDNNMFEFRSLANHYKERHSANFIQIPLMVQFQPQPDILNYFVALGIKMGIPIKGKYKSSVDLFNAGYYEYEDYTYYDHFMGFGDYDDIKSNGTWDFKPSFLLSAELGYKWKLNNQMSLYTGLYYDLSLNTINKDKSGDRPTNLVAYNSENPTNYAVNSVIYSPYTQNDIGQPIIEKIRPTAMGIKVKLTLGKDPFQKKLPPDDVPCFPKPSDVGKEVVIEVEPEPEPEPPVEEVIEPIPTQKFVLIYAVDKEDNTLFPIDLNVKNLVQVNEIIRPTEDGKGGYLAELTLNDSYEIDISKVGYTYSVTQFLAQPTDEIEIIRALLEELTTDTKMVFDNISFDTNSAQLHEDSYEELSRIVRLMKDNPALRLEISAHTDDVGADDFNLRLSERRAKSVTDYLISQGVPAASLTPKGYGKTQPIVPNTSAENRAKNRRVELKIIE